MNISSIGQTAAQLIQKVQSQSLGGARRQDGNNNFAALSGALKSSDLSSASKAFSDIRNLLTSAGSIGAANHLKTDLDAIGKALRSGDLNQARQDISQLKADVRSALQPRHGVAEPGRPSAVDPRDANTRALLG